MKQKMTDGQKIRTRKIAEDQWLVKWRGRLSTPGARIDLFRWYLRKGVIDIESFRRIKAGFYDDEKS